MVKWAKRELQHNNTHKTNLWFLSLSLFLLLLLSPLLVQMMQSCAESNLCLYPDQKWAFNLTSPIVRQVPCIFCIIREKGKKREREEAQPSKGQSESELHWIVRKAFSPANASSSSTSSSSSSSSAQSEHTYTKRIHREREKENYFFPSPHIRKAKDYFFFSLYLYFHSHLYSSTFLQMLLILQVPLFVLLLEWSGSKLHLHH